MSSYADALREVTIFSAFVNEWFVIVFPYKNQDNLKTNCLSKITL